MAKVLFEDLSTIIKLRNITRTTPEEHLSSNAKDITRTTPEEYLSSNAQDITRTTPRTSKKTPTGIPLVGHLLHEEQKKVTTRTLNRGRTTIQNV